MKGCNLVSHFESVHKWHPVNLVSLQWSEGDLSADTVLSADCRNSLCVCRSRLPFAMGIVALMCIMFLVLGSASADSHSNPADELVDVLNKNRTAHKATRLQDNPGLACIALQYIKAYDGDCDKVGPHGEKPPDSSFAETFAPKCGVEVSSLGPITGRLLACQSKYVDPSEAFSQLLIRNDKSLSILYDKNHSEVGAGVQGTDGGGPYFWCVLFSSGSPESSFKLQGGTAIKQRPGCYSGTNDACSAASTSGHVSIFMGLILAAAAVASIFVL